MANLTCYIANLLLYSVLLTYTHAASDLTLYVCFTFWQGSYVHCLHITRSSAMLFMVDAVVCVVLAYATAARLLFSGSVASCKPPTNMYDI